MQRWHSPDWHRLPRQARSNHELGSLVGISRGHSHNVQFLLRSFQGS
jgi:hypothetical protein